MRCTGLTISSHFGVEFFEIFEASMDKVPNREAMEPLSWRHHTLEARLFNDAEKFSVSFWKLFQVIISCLK